MPIAYPKRRLACARSWPISRGTSSASGRYTYQARAPANTVQQTMTIADTLRARFPEWKNRPELASLNTLLETALSFVDVPKIKKAAIGKTGRLNSSELARALRRELGREIVPAIRCIRRVVDEDTRASSGSGMLWQRKLTMGIS